MGEYIPLAEPVPFSGKGDQTACQMPLDDIVAILTQQKAFRKYQDYVIRWMTAAVCPYVHHLMEVGKKGLELRGHKINIFDSQTKILLYLYFPQIRTKKYD